MEDNISLLFFGVGAVVLATSLLAKFRVLPEKFAVSLLFLAGFFIGMGCISAELFIYPWDERFHALVAKNMLYDPLHPKLYIESPLSGGNHDPWWAAHVWLHKGPLFSWQMAVCMAIFGKNIIAIRLASVAMVLLIAYSGYRTTRLFFPKAAFTVALILCLQPFLFLLASGRIGMDHNDLAFTAYISASFWAWTEFINSGKKKWIFWIALAASCAILTKWFAGSLVYFIWGLYILVFEIKNPRQWKALIISALICLAIFGPWFLYSYVNFKEVLLREWELNGASHLFTVLDNHITPWYFHFQTWWEYLLVPVLFFGVGLGALPLAKSTAARRIGIVAVTAIALAMALFTVAQTRMPGYTVILLPMVMFIAAAGVNWLLNLSGRKWFEPTVIGVLGIALAFHFYDTFEDHRPHEIYARNQLRTKEFYTELKEKIPANSVIFNSPQMEFVDVMFYTECTAYEQVPSPAEVNEIVAKGYQPVLILDNTFTREEFEKLDYLQSYPVFQWPY